MTALNANCSLNWDVNYYLKHIVLDDLKNHSIEATEEKLQFSRDRINDFLQDCLRVGKYFFYNFYGLWKDEGSVYFGIYHKWSYDFYLQKHFLSLSTDSNDPGNCYINKEIDETIRDVPRYIYVLQTLPYLPHPEVIKACGLMPSKDRPGIRRWHNGGLNYRLGVMYEFTNEPVEIPEDLYDQILAYNVPILADYVKYLTIKNDLGRI